MTIEQILQKEDVRRIDGRWSGGFVDMQELDSLISTGKAEVYEWQGMGFVRLVKKEK